MRMLTLCSIAGLGCCLTNLSAAQSHEWRDLYEVEGAVEVALETLTPYIRVISERSAGGLVNREHWVSVSMFNHGDAPASPDPWHEWWVVSGSDWRTGESLWQYRTSVNDHTVASVREGVFSEDGDALYLGGYADPFAKVIALNSRSGEPLWEWKERQGGVWDLALSPDGERLFVAGRIDGEPAKLVAALDADSGEEKWLAAVPGVDLVRAELLALGPDEDILFVLAIRGDGPRRLLSFDASTGAVLSEADVRPFSGRPQMVVTPEAVIIGGTGEWDDSMPQLMIAAYNPETGEEMWARTASPQDTIRHRFSGITLSLDKSFAFLAGSHDVAEETDILQTSTLRAYSVMNGELVWERIGEHDGGQRRPGPLAVDPVTGALIAAEANRENEFIEIRSHQPETGKVEWIVTRRGSGGGIYDVQAVSGGISIFVTGIVHPEYPRAAHGSIALRPGSPRDFGEWQEWHFTATERQNPEIANTAGDPGGYGVSNLHRYALALNAYRPQREKLPSARTVSIGINGNIERYLGLSFTQRPSATDIEYVPEVSGDMKEWIRVPEANVMRREENADGTETVTIADWVPMGDEETDRRFMRLRVERIVNR